MQDNFLSNRNYDEADYEGPDQPTHQKKLNDFTKMMNFQLDKPYKNILRQQGYLEDKKDSTFKSDFNVFEFFEDDYGKCKFQVKDGMYMCKKVKTYNQDVWKVREKLQAQTTKNADAP